MLEAIGNTIAHSGALAAAVDLPVSADLEGGFGDAPDDVAETVRRARAAGLAGCSIEDATGRGDDPVYTLALAVERVEAAVDAGAGLVLTARAENHLHGRDDIGDTIARLQAFAGAGADVLYAPGLKRADDIRSGGRCGCPAAGQRLDGPRRPARRRARAARCRAGLRRRGVRLRRVRGRGRGGARAAGRRHVWLHRSLARGRRGGPASLGTIETQELSRARVGARRRAVCEDRRPWTSATS